MLYNSTLPLLEISLPYQSCLVSTYTSSMTEAWTTHMCVVLLITVQTLISMDYHLLPHNKLGSTSPVGNAKTHLRCPWISCLVSIGLSLNGELNYLCYTNLIITEVILNHQRCIMAIRVGAKILMLSLYDWMYHQALSKANNQTVSAI